MNGREPGGVAELGLCNRHLKGLAVYQADGSEAHIDLAQDVRDPGVGIAATDLPEPAPDRERLRVQGREPKWPSTRRRDAVGPA